MCSRAPKETIVLSRVAGGGRIMEGKSCRRIRRTIVARVAPDLWIGCFRRSSGGSSGAEESGWKVAVKTSSRADDGRSSLLSWRWVWKDLWRALRWAAISSTSPSLLIRVSVCFHIIYLIILYACILKLTISIAYFWTVSYNIYRCGFRTARFLVFTSSADRNFFLLSNWGL